MSGAVTKYNRGPGHDSNANLWPRRAGKSRLTSAREPLPDAVPNRQQNPREETTTSDIWNVIPHRSLLSLQGRTCRAGLRWRAWTRSLPVIRVNLTISPGEASAERRDQVGPRVPRSRANFPPKTSGSDRKTQQQLQKQIGRLRATRRVPPTYTIVLTRFSCGYTVSWGRRPPTSVQVRVHIGLEPPSGLMKAMHRMCNHRGALTLVTRKAFQTRTNVPIPMLMQRDFATQNALACFRHPDG